MAACQDYIGYLIQKKKIFGFMFEYRRSKITLDLINILIDSRESIIKHKLGQRLLADFVPAYNGRW